MPAKRVILLLSAWWLVSIGGLDSLVAAEQTNQQTIYATFTLTNIADVRNLPPEKAAQRWPVQLRGVATYVFDTHSCFIQDASAGIFVGNGAELPVLTPGDVVELEGVSGPGEYAPIVLPSAARIVGHTRLPAPLRVAIEDLVTGSEDSQWVEVSGLARAIYTDPVNGCILEIASGSDRLTAYVPSSAESNATYLVDSRVRVRGVCGSWFNKQRQLFGVRLMVPRLEDIVVEAAAPTNALMGPAKPIGDLMRFAPNHPAYGRRIKVMVTVVLQQPGTALFVEDEQHGLYVRTRQAGLLTPGDRVELVGFPVPGDYTPILEDATWKKMGSGPEPPPVAVNPDQALGGVQDCRLVSIEGRLIDRTHNNNESVLLLEEDNHIFSARLESTPSQNPAMDLQNGSRLRLTGVCRIEVGDDWRAGPAWRAKSFRILLRNPADIQVLKLPPWWTLPRLLWAVGILVTTVLASLLWVRQLRRKVGKQTTIIRQQLELEASLKERFQDLFENAYDMVYTHDLSGRITSINPAGESLLGRDRGFITERLLLDFVAEEQRQSASQWLEQIMDGKAPATVEWDFVSPSGARIRLEISTRLIEREGKHVEVEGIARDVTERRRLEKEILEISTREQRRIGHDLHDGICQQLAGIGFLSDILADKLEEQSRPEALEAQKIAHLVNKTNKQTRGVARGLFPVRLEENGLVSALQELAQDSGAFFNTRCEFHCDEPVLVREHAVALHLYYIAQEAILNAVKHGAAHVIEVRLSTANGEGCQLTVRNDGAAMKPSEPQSRGMGIRIMNYRARMIGATLRIGSPPAGGTEVVCQFALGSKPAKIHA